ncbi:MAG TPA: FecR domain-containing protein [Puia sp.]|nr:FecR domain-containing protein [Puia sp.]
MDQERIFNLWARYLANEATPEEVEELEWAFQANPGLRRMAEFLVEAHQSPPKGLSVELEQEMLERGLQQFKEPSPTSLPVIKRIPISGALQPTSPRLRARLFPMVAAASILVLVAGLVLYLHTVKQSHTDPTIVAAPRGAKKSMQLSDGSKVWLNAGSRIVISNTFASGNREVSLEGEAFFDVKHDEQHPFIIHVGSLDVRVLGTTLNVRAYPGDSTVETTLINGKVEVEVPGNAASAIVLHPNEKLTISNSLISATRVPTSVAHTPMRFVRRPVEPDRTDGTITETSWVSNKLVFRQETLAAMAVRLERWYDVTIVFDNQRFRNDTLSGTFPQEPLDDVMHALQITAGFHYRIDKDTVRIW